MNSVFIASLIILLTAVSRTSAIKNKNGSVNEATFIKKPEGIARKLIFLSKKTSKLLQLFNELKLVLRNIENKLKMTTNRRLNDTGLAKVSNYTNANLSMVGETRNPDTRNTTGNSLSNSEYRPIIRQAFSVYKRAGCSKFQCPLIVKNRKMDAKGNIIVPASQGLMLRGCGDKQYMLSKPKKTADMIFGLCCSLGMDLGQFDSTDEIKCVYQLLKEKTGKPEEIDDMFGIGYFDMYLNRNFTTCIGRGQVMSPALWALGEPDNKQNSEPCTVVKLCDCPKIGVHDVACFSAMRYLCTYDPQPK